jgi:hypothetical protein
VRLRLALGAAAALGAASAAPAFGTSPHPDLRSVQPSRGHVIAVFDPGELAPLRVAIASNPATGPSGAFVRTNVRLDEVIGNASRVLGGLRLRTRGTLPPGRYWVEVSARPLDVDCLPLKPCLVRWSNVRLVLVPG